MFKSGSSWKSLNSEAKRVVKEAENCLLINSLTSNERVSRLDQTRTISKMYEQTDEQLKQKWRITQLFARIQEFVLGISTVREALSSRVEKLFRGYSLGLLVESFAKKRFSNSQSLVDEVTDGMESASAKEGASRYFVKEELLRERADLFSRNYGTL